MSRPLPLLVLLATLALSPSGPASAFPVFTEPYGNLFAARTTYPSGARAEEPGSVPGAEAARGRWLGTAFVRDDDRTSMFGGGIGYAGSATSRHPWGGYFHAFSLGLDGTGRDLASIDAAGKLVLWRPESPGLPVFSLVGRYVDPDDIGRRWDVLVAVDQRLGRSSYLTANAGLGRGNLGLADVESDLVAGLGATWSPCPCFSLSADYVFDNDLDGEDTWSVAGTWSLGRSGAVRLGGGKHAAIFASLILHRDAR